MLGSGLQGYANWTVDAFLVALLLFVGGLLVVGLLFSGRRPEMRAFMLTYGVCVFAGGLAQCYSLAVFHNPQSTIDAVEIFFPNISSQPPFTTIANMPHINAPLAILIWEQLYKLTWWLGLNFGPYTGVMLNSFVMGLTGSITVRTARELFADDAWRLLRVRLLFAFCGLFILFGAVLLRDCFTTFFNALVIWGIIRWLCRPTSTSLLLAGVLTGISVAAIAYLRFESIVLFGQYWFLAFLFWFTRRSLNIARLFAMVTLLLALLFGTSYLISYVQTSRMFRYDRTQAYAEASAAASREDSLAMQLIVRQPMPIRLVLGSGSMMIFPIPLWSNFKSGASEYHLIKGYHGIYQVFVFPLVFAGFIMAIRTFFKRRQRLTPLLFLAIYLLMNTLAVVATSLEQRHLAQFMPAMMILAAVPDTRERDTRKRVRIIATSWFAIVFLVHLAWTIATMGR